MWCSTLSWETQIKCYTLMVISWSIRGCKHLLTVVSLLSREWAWARLAAVTSSVRACRENMAEMVTCEWRLREVTVVPPVYLCGLACPRRCRRCDDQTSTEDVCLGSPRLPQLSSRQRAGLSDCDLTDWLTPWKSARPCLLQTGPAGREYRLHSLTLSTKSWQY